MAAPIVRVAPNGFITGPLSQAITDALAAGQGAESPGVHRTISTFGAVVSSTVPGVLHRSAVARSGIRRYATVR